MDKTPSWVKHFDENYRLAKRNEIEFSSRDSERDLVADCEAPAVSFLVFFPFVCVGFFSFNLGVGVNVLPFLTTERLVRLVCILFEVPLENLEIIHVVMSLLQTKTWCLEQGGIYIAHTHCDTGLSIFAISFIGPSNFYFKIKKKKNNKKKNLKKKKKKVRGKNETGAYCNPDPRRLIEVKLAYLELG
jgi:hypothetical protein